MEVLRQPPLHLRVIRYKHLQEAKKEYNEWEKRNHWRLFISWTNYINQVKFMKYEEYTEHIYRETLPEVDPRSYKKEFK